MSALRAAIALAVIATGPGEARADDVDACVTASDKGQELRDQGRLRAARERFVACAAKRCPAIVQKDCAAWMAEVDEKLPTVAIHARDAEGRDIADVRVSVDGEAIAERLDGRALTVDPGSRTFRFVKAGAPEVAMTLLLREGEKGRLVDVVLGAPALAGVKDRTFSVPPAAWVLGGVSIAAIGAGVGFGLAAKTAVDDMRATGGCAPFCDPARVDGARRDMILANVLFGVGGAALATGVILTIVRARTAAEGPPIAAWHLGAGPGGLSLSGVF